MILKYFTAFGVAIASIAVATRARTPKIPVLRINWMESKVKAKAPETAKMKLRLSFIVNLLFLFIICFKTDR